MTKKICKSKADTDGNYVHCSLTTRHRLPHRSTPGTWYDEDSHKNLKRRFLEWSKPAGRDAVLRKAKARSQEKKEKV